jgi:2-methylcitrate dehydratase PrpD
MAQEPPDATGVLARYIATLDLATVPAEVVDYAKLVVADTIGVMLAASAEPAAQKAIAAYPLAERGPCTVVGVGRGAGADHAALINGIAGHDIELDDVHTSSRTHPACVVVPAALAVAEERRASGAQLLAAVIAGFDVEARMSKAMLVQPPIDRGFHLSGVCGAVGAAAAGALLYGLTAEQTRFALALGAAQSSGLLTFEEDHSHMLKSFNTGAAARSGVCAAQLAAVGYLAAPDVLSGRHNALAPWGRDDPDFARLTAGLGEQYEIFATSLKRHACCSQTHAAIDALLDVQERHGIGYQDIDRIDVRLAHDALSMIDHNELWTHNIQYVLALAAHEGRVGREHFAPRWTTDPDVAALAARVALSGDDTLQSRFPGQQGAVIDVHTRDGESRRLECVAPVGTPDQPMSESQLWEKFASLAAKSASADSIKPLWDTLMGLEGVADVSELFAPA